MRRAARRGEDVVTSWDLALEALDFGFPRLVVGSGKLDHPWRRLDGRWTVPELRLTPELLAAWAALRVSAEVPPARGHHLAACLRSAIDDVALQGTWVDRTLADLSRFAGSDLPPALRAFGRKVLEFPSYYRDLQPLAASLQLSRGALKARFRRRGLDSPYTYLRWFRTMACAHVLSDRHLTVAQVATRTGFTSNGNLCRTVIDLTGMTPTDLRHLRGWNRLLMGFAWRHLDRASLAGWRELEDLFPSRVA